MDDIKSMELWCEAQIELLQESLENKRVMSNGRRRYLMGEISGIEKVLAKLRKIQRESKARK